MKVKPAIKEKIIAAANALAAEGIESPTNDQVRERMGGGSLSHISPVMREWREFRKAEVAAGLEIPADLKRVIETSLAQVWTAASQLASAAVETIRQEADATIAAATSERDEALAEITRLEETLADKQQAVNKVQAELEKERGQSAKLVSTNAALTARVDDRDEQIRDLKTELKAARDDNKSLQDKLVEIARKAKK